MKIGNAIEEIRKLKKVTQLELATKSNITQSYLSLIENNKKEPNLKTLKEISNSLNIPLPFLLLFSVDNEDISESKQQTFSVILPLLKSLLKEYTKDGND